MAVIISGILRSPANAPMPDIDIILKSLENSKYLPVAVESRISTEADGSYQIDVPPGLYSVSLAKYGQRPAPIGKIRVYEDSQPADLNTFLGAPATELSPEWFRAIETERQAAAQSALAAKDSEIAAASSAQAATAKATQVENAAFSANQAATNAVGAEANVIAKTGEATAASQAALSYRDETQGLRDETQGLRDEVKQFTGIETVEQAVDDALLSSGMANALIRTQTILVTVHPLY